MKSFKKILIVLSASLVLTSCQYSYLSCDNLPPTGVKYCGAIGSKVFFWMTTEEERLAYYEHVCESNYGLKPNTTEMTGCIERKSREVRGSSD